MVSSKMYLQRACLSGNIQMWFHLYVFPRVSYKILNFKTSPRRCKFTCMYDFSKFSQMYFQMSSKIACPNRCIVALVAFVWLFPRVNFQMFSQIACVNRSIITLVAFVGLFSRVRFQMSSQTAWRIRWKVSLLTLLCVLFVGMRRITPWSFRKRRWVHIARKYWTDWSFTWLYLWQSIKKEKLLLP